MEPSATGPRWRWAIHFALLTAYPVVLGIVGAIHQGESSAPMLPTDVLRLLRLLAADFALFAVIFGVALAFSRPSARDLFLAWNGGARPIVRGFLYSIGLRAALFVLVLIIAVIVSLVGGGGAEKIAEELRPETENLVDAKALASHPAYFLVNLTLVSFVFAGFREELWRAGMVAGFVALWPRRAKPQAQPTETAPPLETADAVKEGSESSPPVLTTG